MNAKAVLVLAAILLVASVSAPVHAASDAPESTTIECEGEDTAVDVETAVALFEDNTDAIPDVIKPVLPSNVTHLQIDGAENGDFEIVLDKEFNVESVEPGEPDDPDVIVKTDRETSCELVTAEDPVATFTKAYEAGDVEVEPTGTVAGAAVYLIELIRSLTAA